MNRGFRVCVFEVKLTRRQSCATLFYPTQLLNASNLVEVEPLVAEACDLPALAQKFLRFDDLSGNRGSCHDIG